MKLNLNDKFALVAKTKSGKSFIGKILQRAYPRKIIIDSTYEYTPDLGEIITGFDNFCKKIKEIENRDNYSIIFRFDFNEHNQDQIFEQICKMVFYLGDTMLVVEEVHLFSKTSYLNPWLLKIATMGSHQNVSYLITTQRPSLLNKTLLTQCDHIFIGSLLDENDISYVKSFCGAYAKELSSFPARKFIYWSIVSAPQVISTENLK